MKKSAKKAAPVIEVVETVAVEMVAVAPAEKAPLRDDRGADVIRKKLDSHIGKDTSGSIFQGLRLFKTGEYAANRIWHALIQKQPVFVCETENIGKGNWVARDFAGSEHIGRSRNEVMNSAAKAFLEASAS